MAPSTNRYGLNRNIPAAIKRKVRQRCGFGCVVCGLSIFEYEHFNPELSQARSHDPDGITLLCPTCHTRKDKGLLSLDKIKYFNDNPSTIRNGFSSEFLSFLNENITIKFAGNLFINCNHILTVYERPILWIQKSPIGMEPIILNARFINYSGSEIAGIYDNEWRSITNNWDVTFEGNLLNIYNFKARIDLKIKFNLPNSISIEKLRLRYKNARICGDIYGIEINEGSSISNCKISDCQWIDCFYGIRIEAGQVLIG